MVLYSPLGEEEHVSKERMSGSGITGSEGTKVQRRLRIQSLVRDFKSEGGEHFEACD
jgi:hypothetical protein